ncbi:beta-1,3-galactosyl-O-glycosyl-glycoprotein beta-1,6-N-acetylglucosaminyltransferase 7 isoform X2 [Hemitrygon akajei]|uniref:beta-1,3-galactosyl-O-glycosyl-glycoprotein beta-1,6-N-acetylglucosaminyltransferase 7 isoform X2 n=1 Tax=Hemitrygon akajei TaxID=2704970 RepID=UPI003BF9819C
MTEARRRHQLHSVTLLAAKDKWTWTGKLKAQVLHDAPNTTPNLTWDGDIRAVVWAPSVGPALDGCHGHYTNDICVYGLRNLKWIIQQPDLFANKFEQTTSPLTVACMEQWHRECVLNQTSEIIQPHWHLKD